MMTRDWRGWRQWLLASWLILAGIGVAQAVDPVELPDPQLQQRYWDLSHELRCMQCQNQSIADSPVGLAGDLRREVRELLLAGKTDQEIRDHLVARYGDFILFQILAGKPRSTAVKQRLYERLAERLHADLGIHPDNLMVVIQLNGSEEWSFGRGLMFRQEVIL